MHSAVLASDALDSATVTSKMFENKIGAPCSGETRNQHLGLRVYGSSGPCIACFRRTYCQYKSIK